MQPLPCSDPHVLLPEVCPATDPRCTGCARQVGMFAGLLRAIKRTCGIGKPVTGGVRIEAARQFTCALLDMDEDQWQE